MKRTLFVIAAVAGCGGKSTPVPEMVLPPVAPAAVDAAPAMMVDAGAVPDAVPDQAAGGMIPAPSGVPVYRTDKTTDHVDPAIAGHGKTFMVVSENGPSSEVGKAVMAKGGNAVDAAIATAFMLAVVHPQAGNLGGGGFAVVRAKTGRHDALDFRETAPAAATAEMYLDADGKPTDASKYGPKAAGTPGAVAGLWALHEKYGRTPWAELIEPAIAAARDGFVIDEYLAGAIRLNPYLAKDPGSVALWFVDGKPRAQGTVMKIPELAVTLERIAHSGARGFYEGPVADAIAAEQKADGGLITKADLAAYKAVWRVPVEFGYRGYRLASMPLPSSGGIALAMLANMLTDHITPAMAWHGADHLHRLVESLRRVYATRNIALGDPAFAKGMPVALLTSKKFADEQAKTIDDAHATKSTDVKPIVEGMHTTNLVAVDAQGQAIALTTTVNFTMGAGVTVRGAGFLLNDEMDDFAVKPGMANGFGLVQGEKNAIAPGKRMLSSMSPTIVEDGKGKLEIVIGAGRGGPRIITAVWQSISNMLDFKMSVAAAIAAPRIHHQHLPDTIKLEAESVTAEVAAELKRRGHDLTWGEPSRIFGAVNAIERAPGAGGGWDGAADPRGGGAAMGD